MIFRSNNEDDGAKITLREAVVLTPPVALHGDARAEDDDVPVGRNKLSALKRKLFPARTRRHPARIPPLVVSPISAGSGETRASSGNNAPEEEGETPERGEEQRADDAVDHVEGRDVDEAEHGVWTGGDDDIDDDLLEAIEEADRLQSTTPDETLAQMSRAIEELHQWKATQALATQSALSAMEENVANEVARQVVSSDADEAHEAALREEAERNQRVAEAARAKLSLVLMQTEATMAARRNDNQQVARVLEAATREAADSDAGQVAPKALSKLREEVFDLGVKELSSKLQASWLHELEGADDELDMKLFDVEAYASDLDTVLAQFDAVGAGPSRDTGQNTAGQVPQEH